MVGRVVRLLVGSMFVVQSAGVAIAIRTKRRVVPAVHPASDEVVLSSIFGPLDFREHLSRLRGLRPLLLYGGAQILVPESWDVRTRVIGLGGARDGRPAVKRPDDAIPDHRRVGHVRRLWDRLAGDRQVSFTRSSAGSSCLWSLSIPRVYGGPGTR
jgi:hypothetical protein